MAYAEASRSRRSPPGSAANRRRSAIATACEAPMIPISALGQANVTVAPSPAEFIAMYAPP